MIIRELPLPIPENSLPLYLKSAEKTVFFDIETTGLSWRSSHLYLIGAAFFQEGRFFLRQWFLEKPQEEAEVLEQFSGFLRKFTTAVHYNGQTFDLPYLIHKYAFYHLEDPLSGLESLDLYRVLRPWQKLFCLSSLKQKDAERFLGISREDCRSGGELISCYQDYLRTAAPELLQLLLLHNHDDIAGLIQLLPILGYRRFSEGACTVTEAALKKGELSLSLLLFFPLPVPFSAKSDLCRLQAADRAARIHVDLLEEELKHFFDSYKDYYYLPEEDCAVHKSVGIYVDPRFRRKASARNCYQRVSGLFLPQPSQIFRPVFYRDYGTRPAYFQLKEDMLKTPELLLPYVRSLLDHLPELFTPPSKA